MSTVVQVLPSSLIGVPYLTDRAIVGATDISTLYYNAGQVTNITKDVRYLEDPDGLGVFKLVTHLSKEVGEGTLYEYEAGPLTFKLQLTKSYHLSLQTFFSPPLFATILVNSSYNTLHQGITATIGPADILDGTVIITKGVDNKPHLKYDITLVIGGHKRYRGNIVLDFNYRK